MSDILVVGSLAYDSIKTPRSAVEKALGGSANYFSMAASLFAGVRVVGVVGEDYDDKDLRMLKDRTVDTSGLMKVPGKTFHWAGEYRSDMNEAITLKTDLNVFEHFNPELPEHYKDTPFVFLANISPDLQLRVLEQVKNPRFVGSDTMNFWIQSRREDLAKVLKKVDILLINEGEARMLTDAPNAIAAAAKVKALGPKNVVIKRGEYGFVFHSEEGYFNLPAFPVAEVIDPTGAGDSFAGGFFGYLASLKQPVKVSHIKAACLYGSALASFTIQDFSLDRLRKLTKSELETRVVEYRKVISLD